MKNQQYIARFFRPDGSLEMSTTFFSDDHGDAAILAMRRWPVGASDYDLSVCNTTLISAGARPVYLDALLADLTPEDMARKIMASPAADAEVMS